MGPAYDVKGNVPSDVIDYVINDLMCDVISNVIQNWQGSKMTLSFVQSAQFMEFSEVENHTDFYMMEDGIIHTQDQRGAFIMYDIALTDLQELQEQILLMTTHLIEEDKSNESSNMDLSDWAHVRVDRFAVILDLWTWESALLENKQQLVEGYYEAYQHVLDPEERFALAQVITDIMFRRPLFDIGSKDFLNAYRDECQCLRLHIQLVTNVINSQIECQREFIKKVWRNGENGDVYDFGLPLNIITKPLVSLHTSSSAVNNVHLLEFHPSLGSIYLIYRTLEHICQEFQNICQAKAASQVASLEKQVLLMALNEWKSMQDPQSFYSANVRKDLFEDVVAEDPLLIREICLSALESETDEEKRQSRARPVFVLDTFSKILELITLRHRLIETAAETAVLSRTYKSYAAEMGFSDFHLYLRPVHFEFASHKTEAVQLPPLFITAVLGEESSVDRYIPSTNLLAIHEIDENQIGKFSFWTRDGILQLLHKSGVENMQVALACQITQKNALLAAAQLASLCHTTQSSMQSMDFKNTSESAMARRKSSAMIEKNPACWSITEMQRSLTPVSHASGIPPPVNMPRKRLPEAFVSIQLEKVGLRDTMLNMFIQKKQSMSTAMRNPVSVYMHLRE
ncbi:uncharacterized protein LOC128657700 [Bombina bombina]|uniref:uncharacterized protein LOC128657700 n=1 Tax=Bombina bombina TaxID=8345 RepID=UPI00235A8C25|nr:uncharacterized protein LOC128657700 [Bombina bombina]